MRRVDLNLPLSSDMIKANGTWTSNRRGRKRKNPTPDKWPPTVKRHNKWGTPDEDLTEDDLDDVDSDEADYMEEPEPNNPSTYRDTQMNVSWTDLKFLRMLNLIRMVDPISCPEVSRTL